MGVCIFMMSILGKLIRNELGEKKYDIYFESYNKSKRPNEIVFYDIYTQLKNKDIETLQGMLGRLLDAIELSVRISKQYRWVWLATIVTVILLFILPVPCICSLLGIIIVVGSFFYKSMVFIINRYCFIDVNIVLIYKIVLYQLILKSMD